MGALLSEYYEIIIDGLEDCFVSWSSSLLNLLILIGDRVELFEKASVEQFIVLFFSLLVSKFRGERFGFGCL